MMNRTWRSVFSILLAVALLLPMAPAAHAAGETVAAERVELSSNVSGNLIYYRDGNVGEITITAIVTPSAYQGKIQWELSSNPPLTVVSQDDTVSGGHASITLKATSTTGTVSMPAVPTVTAIVDGATVNGSISTKVRSDPFVVKVAKDAVDISALSFAQSAVSVQIGKTAKVSLNKTPAYPSGVGTPTVTYESSAPNVATVDANGVVKGLKEGGAYISAMVDGTALSTKVNVSVVPVSTELTGSATVGTNFSMRDIYDSLLAQYSSAHGKVPSSAARVSFPSLNKANGTLMTEGGKPVVANDPYRFSDLRTMYLSPSNQGTFKCTAVLTDGTDSITGTITISIAVPTVTIRIPIDGSSNYVFSKPCADASGKSGAKIIRESIGQFGSILFGELNASSSNVGTLYTDADASNLTRVSFGTVVAASDIDQMFFTPSRAGTYSIPYTAYYYDSGSGAVACTGEMIFSVDGSSLDLTANLNTLKPYTFSASPNGEESSVYSQLLAAINSSVGGSAWGGIKFDGAASASSTGTLHQSSEHSRAISASDYIPKASISQLYYVPDHAATYEITYGVYASESSDKPIATGKLTFVTSTIPAGISDITYTTSVNNTVSFRESDFVDFFQTENGGRYQLSYVVFNEYNGAGTFYHGTNTFVPYNSPDCYTGTYSGSVPANAHYLDRLSFKAPSSSGYTALLFTCYGGTSANGTNRVTSGKLSIYYTANEVPVVSYNAYGVSSVELRESDFLDAYNAAMKTSGGKPTVNFQLLGVPSKGTLSYYYGSSTRTLTGGNISQYTFSINGPSDRSISNLTYSPSRGGIGTDAVTYTATAANGTVLYVGTLQFKLSSDLTLNVTNDGSNFQLSDFYSPNDSDPILYVTFPKPASGKLYVYDGSRYITADTETKFYTVSSSDGQYPITSAFYAPKANEAGTITLQCVSHRKSGAKNTNSITINVLSKTSSGSFGDVGGVTGWASNSIDFASKLGLVKGTQANPPLFSPSNTMRRCDFVLMLYRLAGSPKQNANTIFPDVTADKYYYDSAVWAYRNNIMRNVTVNNQYNPDGALTRQDFAQILFNYTNAMGERNTSNNGTIRGYADASKVSSNTVEGVTWAVANGYITSAVVGQLYIEPQRAATRAEISTLLHRYLTY